jgi:endogenous inhibitor of DNA gyrase (YacG/DUF329 family)
MEVEMGTESIFNRFFTTGDVYIPMRSFFITFFLCLFCYSGIFMDNQVNNLNASTLKCSVCGKKIIGKYIQNAEGRVFCSKKCLKKTFPKCAVCGKTASIKIGNKYYCSKKCLKTTWRKCTSCGKLTNKGVLRGYLRKFLCKKCAAKPKCFACSMPGEYELADGRYICKECYKTAVFDEDKAVEIAEKVRQLIADNLLMSTEHNINYHLVTLFELKKKNSAANVTELGLFKFSMMVKKRFKTVGKGTEKHTSVKKRISDEHYDIYLLTGLPEKKLQEVAAHELGHDWMQENFPNIDDDLIREGWAEYVASEVNKLLGHEKMNLRMEKNSDPVYGQGYRMIRNYVDEKGINALLEFFKEKNAESEKKY